MADYTKAEARAAKLRADNAAKWDKRTQSVEEFYGMRPKTVEIAVKVCTDCHYVGEAGRKGHGGVEAALYGGTIVGGAIYSAWRRGQDADKCPECNGRMIPVDTPRGRELSGEGAAERYITETEEAGNAAIEAEIAKRVPLSERIDAWTEKQNAKNKERQEKNKERRGGNKGQWKHPSPLQKFLWWVIGILVAIPVLFIGLMWFTAFLLYLRE